MVDALHAAGHSRDGGLWHCDVGQRHLGRLRHGKLLQNMHKDRLFDGENVCVYVCTFTFALCSIYMRLLVFQTYYLNVAGCGGVGSAGEGGVGNSVGLEGGQSVLVFTVSSSLFTALEMLPELRNLLESNRRRHRRETNI